MRARWRAALLLAMLAWSFALSSCLQQDRSDEGAALGVAAAANDLPEGVSLRPAGTIEGTGQGFIEYLPETYGEQPLPLLVFLHGSGENGRGTETSLLRVFGEGIPALLRDGEWPADRPFVVLMPQHGPGPNASPICPPADEVADFLAFAIGEYDVDPDRVFLTGISCGAIGAWDYLATSGGETVAAAVLIAGDPEDAFERAGCELGRVPVWAFHGSRDDIVPVDGIEQTVERLEACTDPAPVDLQLTVYPGVGHDSWTQTYDLTAGNDVYAWLLRSR